MYDMLPMKTRLLLIVLTLSVLSFSGCDRVKKALNLKSSEPVAAEAAGQPSPEASPKAAAAEATPAVPATPTPPPEPTPVAINRNATVIVLCYHRFEDKANDNLAITPPEFEKQMQTLKDDGIEVIGMQDFLAWRRGEKDIPARSAVITIDDGYVSGYSVAWPILKKFDYPFTMFIYLDYVASGGKAMSWAQLEEMRDAGIDIQSHTMSHQSLRGSGPGLSRAAVAEIKKMGEDAWRHKEIAGSKEELEQKLAIRVNALAYPYGMYNSKVTDAVKAAGYEAAFTVYGQPVHHSTEATLLGRYAVGSRQPEIFAKALKDSRIAGQEGAVAAPAVAEVDAASIAPKPADGATVSDPNTVIEANLAAMGAIDPATIELRISGYGLVKPDYDEATKTLTYRPEPPLSDGNYTVILAAHAGGNRVESRWNFRFGAAGEAAPAATPTP